MYFVSICPRISGDRDGVTARSSWLGAALSLGLFLRRVRVDRSRRVIEIEDRVAWFRKRSQTILFEEVAAVTYGYEDWSWSWGAHDTVDRFLVGLRLKFGNELKLFSFIGDGAFKNDGPLPDWWYWKEFAFDVQGSQEQESYTFVRALRNLIGVEVAPSGMTRD